MLQKIGSFCARRHWPIIIGWVFTVLALGVVSQAHHGEPKDKFEIPGTESQKAVDLLASQFPAASGTTAVVVFEAKAGALGDPPLRAAVEQTVTNLKALPNVSSVTGPFDQTPTGIEGVEQGRPVLQYGTLNINSSQTVGFASVQFSEQFGAKDATDVFGAVRKATQPAVVAKVGVNIGGPLADVGNPPDPGISQYSELIGLLFAVMILMIALGSLPSMAVPIGVALVSVGVSHAIVDILEASFSIGSVAPVLGSMIGLGVGIDYSLFIVSRYRQNLSEGMDPHAAIGTAVATSGSAVLFAGITVCMALCGLFFVGIPYVAQLGYISAVFVAVTIVAALTLVPALLGALGTKINSFVDPPSPRDG
jgi:RND superfamily putative drug exporter